MFKKILAASALSLLPTLALAADLPRRSMAMAPSPVAAPLFTWTGFYAGANAGYGWGETRFGRTYSGKTDVDRRWPVLQLRFQR
jgi:opacity protein-like surface antigen